MGASYFGIEFGKNGAHDEEGGCALRVADVVQRLLLRLIEDIIDHLGDVDGAHFVPGEAPELPLERLHSDVLSAVGVSPAVAHPHVVACVGEDVGESLLRAGHNEISGGADETVLHVDRRALWAGFFAEAFHVPWPWNTMQSQVVSIAGYYVMLLGWIAMAADHINLGRRI